MANTTAQRGRESSLPSTPTRPVVTSCGICSHRITPSTMGMAQASVVTTMRAKAFSREMCLPRNLMPSSLICCSSVGFFFRTADMKIRHSFPFSPTALTAGQQ